MKRMIGVLIMVCCWAISASSAFAGTFVDKKDGTVIEVENGLIWQKVTNRIRKQEATLPQSHTAGI